MPEVSNGSRYILSATDRGYEMPTHQLSQMIARLFPHLSAVGGEELDDDGQPTEPTADIMRAYCLLARQELGLRTYGIEETVRATGDSYLALGLVRDPEAPRL